MRFFASSFKTDKGEHRGGSADATRMKTSAREIVLEITYH